MSPSSGRITKVKEKKIVYRTKQKGKEYFGSIMIGKIWNEKKKKQISGIVKRLNGEEKNKVIAVWKLRTWVLLDQPALFVLSDSFGSSSLCQYVPLLITITFTLFCFFCFSLCLLKSWIKCFYSDWQFEKRWGNSSMEKKRFD